MAINYKCLHVEGLAPTATEEALYPIFGAAGDVIRIRKVSPTTATVSYKQEEDARKAIEQLDGSIIDDNFIHVAFQKRKNDNPKNAGAARLKQDQPQESYTSSKVSKKLDVDLCKLKYMHGFPEIQNTLNNLPADVTFDLDSASLSIAGKEHDVAEAIREIEKLKSSFVTVSLTDVFRRCFLTVRPAEIVEKFKSSQIFASWDLSESQLRICSNCPLNAMLALKLIKEIIVESEYPIEGELSAKKISLLLVQEWIHFRNNLTANDTMRCLEIQYDARVKKIRFALRSCGSIHAVVQALERFFEEMDIKEQAVPFSKTHAMFILKNKDGVLNNCSEDGVEFDFGKLSKFNTCIVKSQSTERLNSAVSKLKQFATETTKRSATFYKSSHVAFLKSAFGKRKIADVDSLCHTVSETVTTRGMHKALVALPTAPSKLASASATSKLAGKLMTVRGDIANIEADGLVSCDGVVARAIEKQMNGAMLKPGLQVVSKLVNGEWSEVHVYHIQIAFFSSPEDAMKQLAIDVRRAYQTLQSDKKKVIAFPAIGTGGRGYPPAKAASTIVEIAARYFNPDSTQKVYFVIHPQADDAIYKAFQKELREQIPPPCPPPKPKTRDELTVTFTGFSINDVTQAVERLEEELKHILITQSCDLPVEQAAIKKLKTPEVTNIHSKANEQNVDVYVDVSSGRIQLEGLLDNIAAVRDYVNSILGGIFSPVAAFPEHWDEAALAKGHHEVKLDPYSSEYSVVLCKFFESCTATGIKVTEGAPGGGGSNRSTGDPPITRIQNEHLYTQYQAQKSKVKKELAGDPSIDAERELWHGTSAESVKQICANEFNRSFAGANGIAYGQGSYFSTTTQYSIKYSEGQLDMYMMLAKVATGRYRLGNSDTTRKNLPPGYHSTVDRQSEPSIFVVYHDTAAYPEYVIQFRKETTRAVPDSA